MHKLAKWMALCVTALGLGYDAANAQTTAIASNAPGWRYIDTGTDPGTTWTGLEFDDSAWKIGSAPFGYGDPPYGTTLIMGPDAGTRYIAYFFRKTFVVTNAHLYGSLDMGIRRDDGFVLYLNGQEILRDGMPAGTITATTLANRTADTGAPELTYFSHTAPVTLVEGTNVLAAQVHQVNNTSSDLSWDINAVLNLVPAVSITSPSSGVTVSLPTNVTLTATATDSDGSIARVDFYDGANPIGSATVPPYSVSWSNPMEGPHTITARAVDNTGGVGISAPISVNVVDTTVPTISTALATTNRVFVTFSKRVGPGATNGANYSINSGVTVLGAEYGAGSNIVVLTTSPMVSGAMHLLTVNNVQDLYGNTIAAGSQTSFTVTTIISANVGSGSGSIAVANGGFDITASSAGIGATVDQFNFSYEERTGDFDVQVRVSRISSSDVWARAGLMARESLGTNSSFAAVFSTPSLSGTFFEYRNGTGGASARSGSQQANYPDTYLRLRRTGNVFTGFGSFDGVTWSQLGTVSIVMPATVNIGFAVTSQDTADTVTASFRGYGNTASTAIGSVESPFEPLGPSSRRTPLVISEIMYHPRSNGDGRTTEFVEIFNSLPWDEDIGGYRLDGAIDYTFPPNTIIRSGGFLVVAAKKADVEAAYGITGVLQYGIESYSTNGSVITTNIGNKLSNTSDELQLRNRSDALLLQVVYTGEIPYPVAADGGGHSLVLAYPSYGEADPRAWAASDRVGGSPGSIDGYSPSPLRAIVINEFLANTDAPDVDFIELYNYGTNAVDISGCIITDNPATNKFRIPNGTVLAPRGFVAFDQTQLGFALSSSGEKVFLISSNQARVVDAVSFDAQARGVSSGRYPDGAPTFHELLAPTPATTNIALLIRDIVINEIMYNPITGNDDDEYIELYNKGTQSVDLTGWRFTDGITFTFPAGTIIGAADYLVVARDANRLRSIYTGVAPSKFIGNYSGTLANGGERVALSYPEPELATNNLGQVVTNSVVYPVADEVLYRDGGRWGRWSDGDGSSLELVDSRSDNRLPGNWADSDESQKAPWTQISHTGLLDHGNGTINEVQVMILGRGEALMDNVDVRAQGSTVNLVPNSTFEAGLAGWVRQGNHVRSGLAEEGEFSARSMLLRASSGGDNGANRVEADLSASLSPNTVATISGRFRWLRGHPNVLLRVYGNHIEAAGSMIIPRNLGTPGEPNSARVANLGPAITDVTHNPPTPAGGTPVVVSARVHDTDGIAQVDLRYRIDPSSSITSVPMRDDGTAGDAVAGDGLFSATIPGQSAGTLVAFTIGSTDGQGATLAFPQGAPFREALVRFGDPAVAGHLGAYRLWMVASNIATWSSRERLSNEPLDGTLVYGKRIIYNAGGRYRGSPWIRPGYNGPTGNRCAYVWSVPDDDLLLGADEINLDSLEPGDRDPTVLREITSFWMADQLGLPWSYQRYVHIVINGVANGARGIPIYADTQQPDSDYMKMWFPENSDGDIFKIDDWFEFTDGDVAKEAWNENARLVQYLTTGGEKKKARYRWSWEKKSNGGLNDDYSQLFALVDALTAPDSIYVTQVENLMDTEEVMTASALRHAVGDWDGWTYDRGKNEFLYKPNGGKWNLLLWDLDFSLGCTGGHPPTQNIFQVEGGETSVTRMLNHPHFRRIYLRALQRIAAGPMLDTIVTNAIDARYRGLLANGVVATSPYVGSGAQNIPVPTWISQRRAYILGQIPSATFGLTSTSITTSSNVVTISGTAPLDVTDIFVNGGEFPVTWTSTTAWSVRVPVSSNTVLTVTTRTVSGTSSSQNVDVQYTGGAAPDPEGIVVINEIMYKPAAPNAEFIEFYNRSADFTFDLAGWRVNGIDYVFPKGSFIGPRSYVVLAKDKSHFAAAYGISVPVLDVYAGQLDGNGETITLLRPGATPGQEIVVDKVRYDNVSPWPTNTLNTGSSLQLVDAGQDNSRPGNWTAQYVPAVFSEEISTPAVTNDGWRFVSRTFNYGSDARLLIYLNNAGSVLLDDIAIVPGTNAAIGSNFITNGDFEAPINTSLTSGANQWIFGTNMTASSIFTDVVRSGNGALRLVQTEAGNPSNLRKDLVQTMSPRPTNSQTVTVSFWYWATNNTATELTIKTIGNALNMITNIGVVVIPSNYVPAQVISPSIAYASPGASNQFNATLPEFQSLWINEVQAENTSGILDNNGQREPWIEIYNNSTNTVSLEGLYLSSTYTNLTNWAFPSGASIGPKQFLLVFCDDQPTQTSGSQYHTSFRLPSGSGSIALSRLHNGAPQVLDYINYDGLHADRSFGSYPDGQPFERREFFYVTPGGTNDGRSAPLVVYINEWMAQNNSIVDPADNDFDDWFELYNPGDTAVDISGYYLTDNLLNKFQYQITTNGAHIIPAKGFLLVWADTEINQNLAGGVPREDLHVNFNLRAGGEAIALFGADGTQIDSVVFGQQTNDISQGRFADGGSSIYYMTNPTPRAPNILPGSGNSAPVLDAIPVQVVYAGETVTFTAHATDTAGQAITYSLGAGAPVGASINGTSGVFTWATINPSTNNVVVRATDNGTPSMTAMQTVQIRVLGAPNFGTVSRDGNNLIFNFGTASGRSYKIQYKDDLSEPGWLDLGNAVPASGSSLSITNDITESPQRFFRIRVQ